MIYFQTDIKFLARMKLFIFFSLFSLFFVAILFWWMCSLVWLLEMLPPSWGSFLVLRPQLTSFDPSLRPLQAFSPSWIFKFLDSALTQGPWESQARTTAFYPSFLTTKAMHKNLDVRDVCRTGTKASKIQHGDDVDVLRSPVQADKLFKREKWSRTDQS